MRIRSRRITADKRLRYASPKSSSTARTSFIRQPLGEIVKNYQNMICISRRNGE
jgi:hypothetical protein